MLVSLAHGTSLHDILKVTVDAIPEDASSRSHLAFLDALMTGVYALDHVRLHTLWYNYALTFQDDSVLYREFITVGPEWSQVYRDVGTRLPPTSDDDFL